MTFEQRRAIASFGGRAAHAQGKAHQWTTEEASRAGRKGGLISKRKGVKNKQKYLLIPR